MASYTSEPYNKSVLFIEAPIFSKLVYDYLGEDEYAALQWTLAVRPEQAKIIPGSGGLRKIRWAAKGKGKRGGTRIIYYWQQAGREIWLLTIYAKNEAENIPAHILKRLKEAMEQ
ncbi:MAG: transcriptional regulator [Candidatus Electrothrix sp. AR4]|nr:transcriptional regulator [Candidatus Electrothrix sp. AR4]